MENVPPGEGMRGPVHEPVHGCEFIASSWAGLLNVRQKYDAVQHEGPAVALQMDHVHGRSRGIEAGSGGLHGLGVGLGHAWHVVHALHIGHVVHIVLRAQGRSNHKCKQQKPHGFLSWGLGGIRGSTQAEGLVYMRRTKVWVRGWGGAAVLANSRAGSEQRATGAVSTGRTGVTAT